MNWVLGHMEVEGNERVIVAAKTAAKTRGVRACPERFTSRAHIAQTVTKRK